MTTAPTTASVPIGTPIYGIGFLGAFGRFWRGYVAFQGRASRSEFWWAYLGVFVVQFVLMTIALAAFMAIVIPNAYGRMHEVGPYLAMTLAPTLITLVISLPFLLPSLAMSARRLRDAGFSPLFLLLGIVGLSLVPFIMCILPTVPSGPQTGFGTPQPFGQPPHGQQYGQQSYGQPTHGQLYGEQVAQPYNQQPRAQQSYPAPPTDRPDGSPGQYPQ